MAVNQFLVFAGSAASGNTYSYSEYLSISYRTTGVVAGVADERGANAVWRQTSAMTSALGGFILARLNEDVIDDGTTTNLIAQLQLAIQSFGRIRLTSDLTIYVSPSGNDSTNTGLSAGSPFATIQHAWNVLLQSYDLNGFVATIKLADGVYTTGALIAGPLVGTVGPASVIIEGNVSTPANVYFNITNGNGVVAQAGGQVTVQGITFSGITGSGQTGNGIVAASNGQVNIGPSCAFGTCDQAHMLAEQGGFIYGLNNYSIVGNAAQHFLMTGGSALMDNRTVTLIGTPAFSTAFAQITLLSQLQMSGASFVGSATGTRYLVNYNSVINTNGGGASYFPGSVAGTADGATGGFYI